LCKSCRQGIRRLQLSLPTRTRILFAASWRPCTSGRFWHRNPSCRFPGLFLTAAFFTLLILWKISSYRFIVDGSFFSEYIYISIYLIIVLNDSSGVGMCQHSRKKFATDKVKRSNGTRPVPFSREPGRGASACRFYFLSNWHRVKTQFVYSFELNIPRFIPCVFLSGTQLSISGEYH
jgi:hypothetical protein